MKESVKIAILGLGTVGGGTYELLNANRDKIKASEGFEIVVKKVLDKNQARMDELGVPAAARAKTPDEIFSDPEIRVVAEVIGGVEPAKTFILAALKAGKSVVTANKELIAKAWPELDAAARKSGAGLYFEASCAGGIPIVRTLKESLQGDRITELIGIINGTTNFILSKMSDSGMSYTDALCEAQRLGFAEADPTADVEGFDAMYKLSILSSLAFHTCIPYSCIYREGISGITAGDIAYGRELGYTLKLLAIGRRCGNDIEARVHPAFIRDTHPLAAVRDSYNAVFCRGDFVEDIMLFGRGAGARPTGSAIVSDIVYAAKRNTHEYADFTLSGSPASDIRIVDDFKSAYYLSLTAFDKPGALGRIASLLAEYGVSIHAMTQHGGCGGQAPIVIMTHETGEKAMQTALGQIRALSCVARVNNLLRVID